MSDLAGLRPPAAAVDLWRVAVPLRRAHVASYGAEQRRDVVIVRWTAADGVSGWGECPTFTRPGYVTETTAVAWQRLVADLVPAALAADSDLPDSRGSGPDAAQPSSAVAALRDAALDCGLRAAGRTLVEHLGGTRRPLARTVVIAAPVANDDPVALAAVVERALAARAVGCELVKIKIAPGADVTVLTTLAAELGAQHLAADANGSYASAAALGPVDELGLRYLEQPFAAGLGWQRLGELAAALETPVALDESIRTGADLDAVVASGAGRLVSVKPARVGGVDSAGVLIRRAQGLGLGTFVGGMVELAVGRATALALASMPGLSQPTDLGPSRDYFNDELAAGVGEAADGRVMAPAGPGIGMTPDEAALARLAVDHVCLRAG